MRFGGAERPRLGFGWLQGTTRETEWEWMLLTLSPYFGVVKRRDRGTQWYRESAAVGENGVLVAWEPRTSSSRPDEVYIVVPQQALDGLGWEGQVRFAREMVRLGVRASRVDVYWDDLSRIADPAEVHLAMEMGQTLSHARKYRQLSDSEGGYTTYVGSRQGECMTRTYRKWAESGDSSMGVRWEMEAKGSRAPIVLSLMLASSAPGETFWGLVRAFVDFRDRTGHARGDEAPLLAWWAALIGSADRVRVVGPVVVDSFARRLRWLGRSVAPSLALLFARDGSQGVNELIRGGWDRAPWDLIGEAAR